jgi:hypothetical protein
MRRRPSDRHRSSVTAARSPRRRRGAGAYESATESSCACRTSRILRHLTGVGWSAVPAETTCAAPDVIADVSAHTRSQPALTPHTPDAHTPPVEAAQVEPIVSAQPSASNTQTSREPVWRAPRNRHQMLTPLTRERGGSRAPSKNDDPLAAGGATASGEGRGVRVGGAVRAAPRAQACGRRQALAG